MTQRAAITATTRNSPPTIQCLVQKHAPAARRIMVGIINGNYRFRQINSPLGVTLQSCWMIWFGGRDGTGIGLTGAVCAGGT